MAYAAGHAYAYHAEFICAVKQIHHYDAQYASCKGVDHAEDSAEEETCCYDPHHIDGGAVGDGGGHTVLQGGRELPGVYAGPAVFPEHAVFLAVHRAHLSLLPVRRRHAAAGFQGKARAEVAPADTVHRRGGFEPDEREVAFGLRGYEGKLLAIR